MRIAIHIIRKIPRARQAPCAMLVTMHLTYDIMILRRRGIWSTLSPDPLAGRV